MSSLQTQPNPTRDELISAMKDGAYATCERLPRENDLAKNLGISRTQLRDILAALEQEGFITRRHGVGTIINHHVLNVQLRMDIETEFLDMIRQSGFAPAVAFVRISDDIADKKIAKQLNISEGTPVLRVARLCTADGKPAVYCEDVVDKALARCSYTTEDLELSIFHFLRTFCDVSSYMDLTELHPVAADTKLAELLEVPEGTPLLNMEEINYDINGRPILSSSEYFVDGILQHVVLRKKL